MKTNTIPTRIGHWLLALVVIAFFLFVTWGMSGCTSAPNATPSANAAAVQSFTQAVGPIAVRMIEANLVKKLVTKNPKYVAALNGLDVVLATLADQKEGAEVTDALIRKWVDANAVKLGFLPEDSELIAASFIEVKNLALSNLNVPSLKIGDPRVKPWVDALRGGIRSGLARAQATAAPLSPTSAP